MLVLQLASDDFMTHNLKFASNDEMINGKIFCKQLFTWCFFICYRAYLDLGNSDQILSFVAGVLKYSDGNSAANTLTRLLKEFENENNKQLEEFKNEIENANDKG